jgi:integrase
LRTLDLAVDTHNKKISRPATIFRTLDKYLSSKSPWENKKLKRLPKEETHTAHRQPFPIEKEQMMFNAVKPESSFNPLNKAEIEVLIHILKYTGQRQKDCVNLSWNKISMKRRRLWVTQEKTGKDVTIPIAEELYEMLVKAKEWKEDGNEYVLPKCAKRYARKAKDGTDTGVNLINKQLLGLIKHVGLEPSISIPGRKKKLTIYGVHSFRHGFASHCAETGVPRAVCASILGADADIIDNYYVHIGEEAQLKAIEGLSACNNKSDKDRLSEAIDYIKGLKDRSLELEKVYELLTE